VETEPEYDAWTSNIDKVINPQRLNDFYVKDDLLGQGSFGKVYKGRSKATNEIVAIKYIDKKAMKPHEVSLQMNEIEILKTVSNNPNVIKLIEFFEDSQYFYLVLECVSGKDLFNFISKNKLEERHVQYLFKQIIKGIRYLHEVLGVVHRDIKLENIMMSNDSMSAFLMGNAIPKFIDFGLSKVLLPDERSSDPYGTLMYCSPEIILGKPHTQMTDIWSMGIVLYVLLTNRMPFVTLDRKETSRNIVQQRINFNQSSWFRVSNAAKDLVSRLLDKNQETRIVIKDILKHEWFEQ